MPRVNGPKVSLSLLNSMVSFSFAISFHVWSPVLSNGLATQILLSNNFRARAIGNKVVNSNPSVKGCGEYNVLVTSEIVGLLMPINCPA